MIGRLDGFHFVPDPRAMMGHSWPHLARRRDAGTGKRDSRPRRARWRRGRQGHQPQRTWQAVVGRRHCRQGWCAGASPLAPAIDAGGRRSASAARRSCKARLRELAGGAHRRAPEPLLALARRREARAGSDTPCPLTRAAWRISWRRISAAGPRKAQSLPEKLGPHAASPASPSASGSGGAPSICRGCCVPMRRRCWRCCGASGHKTGISACAARAGPHVLLRARRRAAPLFCMPPAFASLPAAPSASTCWSGWKTNWTRRWPAAPMPRHCCPSLSRCWAPAMRKAEPCWRRWAGAWSTVDGCAAGLAQGAGKAPPRRATENAEPPLDPNSPFAGLAALRNDE